MPWRSKWIPNEEAYRIDGISIYFIHEDNDVDAPRLSGVFTLDEAGETPESFNVRDLPSAQTIPELRNLQDWYLGVLICAIARKEGPFADLPDPTIINAEEA